MNSIAAKIAVEIGVLFEHNHGHARSREQIAGHHPRRSATHDHATCL